MKTLMKVAIAVGTVLLVGGAYHLGAEKAKAAYYTMRLEAGDESARLKLANMLFWQEIELCDDPLKLVKTRLEWVSLLRPAIEQQGDVAATAAHLYATQLATPMCETVSKEHMDLALGLLEAAAAMGHIPSMKWLARHHFGANGSIEDISQAQSKGLLYIVMAAEAGDADAQATLGHRLLHGGHIEQDIPAAAKYLQLAVDQGEVRAMTDLGVIHLERKYEFSVPRTGVELLTNAANAGDMEAAEVLGEAYFVGNSIPRNGVEARKWMIKAAPERPVARYVLAHFYEEGIGGPVDLVNAYAMWSVVWASSGLDSASSGMDRIGPKLSKSEREKAEKIANRFAKRARLI